MLPGLLGIDICVKNREGMLTYEEIIRDIEAETADKASLSFNDRVANDYALKRYRDYYSGLKTAEQKGFDKGQLKGREEDREEGREERQEEIARAMKAKGIDLSLIAECTGLSVEQVAALLDSWSV